MKELRIENSTKVALVDDEDFERLSKLRWILISNSPFRYLKVEKVERNLYSKGYRTVYLPLANEIMKDYSSQMYDHKNRVALDNQKLNIRKTTWSENNINKEKFKYCSSKYKGVHWDSENNKWRVEITHKKNRIRLGRFSCEIQAALVYDKKARELFGEFAVYNFYIT